MGVLAIMPHRIPFGVAIWGFATIMTIGSILYITLAPGKISKGINLLPFREIVRGLQSFSAQNAPPSPTIPLWFVVNLLGNLVLFLPLGFVLMGLLSRLPRRIPAIGVMLMGGVLSVGIEVIQLTIPTRATDIDDVIFNTVSTGLGVILFCFAQNVWQRKGSVFVRGK
jgi:glycopeptide antibiotics resistance protein